MARKIPSLRGIEAFINVAETLSFRVAAERLNITVSAMSHRIHGLEIELGAMLIDRGSRSIKLTPVGELYLDRLLPLFRQMQMASEDVHEAMNSGLVRIASFQLFHAHWLAPRISRFIEFCPGATVQLATLRHRHSGRPDFEIVMPLPGEERSQDFTIFDWAISPACRPELITKFNIREPADLLRCPLIASTTAENLWPKWFEYAGIGGHAPADQIIADAPMMNIELAAGGAGVTMTTAFQSDYLTARGLVRPFPLFCPYPGEIVLRRRAAQSRPVVEAFEKWIRQEINSSIRDLSAATLEPGPEPAGVMARQI